MTPYAIDFDSPSIIIRSTHILLIQVESAKAGPWVEGDGGPERTVELALRIEQILKGAVHDQPGSFVEVTAKQVGQAGSRIYALPGVWSGHSLEHGERLVAFSSDDSQRAADVLTEPALTSLLPADEALTDVELAMRVESGSPIGEVIRLAEASPNHIHYTFAEYLSAKTSDGVLTDSGEFKQLSKLVEDPQIDNVVRSTLISDINSELLARDPAPNAIVSIWVMTLIHVAGMPGARDLHHNILSVFLPNLLGLKGGAKKKTADELFRGHADERVRARQALNAFSDAAALAVQQWLQ